MITAGIAQSEPSASTLTRGRVRTERALRRMAAPYHAGRQEASAAVGWDVAKNDRTRRRFAYISGLYAGADRHMDLSSLAKLREICRAHDRNSALISGILNRAMDNIFGDSFGFVPTTGDQDLDAIAKSYIARRMEPKYCDAAGVSDLVTMSRNSLRGVWNDGDSLAVFRPDGSMLPFEADQIVDPTGSTSPPADKADIVMGVEKDALGRHMRYHVAQRTGSGGTRPVSPANCIFPAWRTRHGQTRGIPYLAAAMSIFERLDGYIDSETFAAELNARHALKITSEAAEDDPDGREDNEDGDTEDTFSKVDKVEMGMIIECLPGEDLGMVESTRPGPQFDSYIRIVARIVGAAVGFPLELALLDFSTTSWASGRLGMDEARRTFRFWQKFADTRITTPWYRRQITRGITTAELPADERLYLHRTHWATWPYIQPVIAATANQIQIANRTKSISECVREQNRDPNTVFAEIAAERKKLAELEISPEMLPQGTPVNNNPEDPEQ